MDTCMHFVEEVLSEFIYSSHKFIEYFYNQCFFQFLKHIVYREKEKWRQRDTSQGERETSISCFPYASQPGMESHLRCVPCP